jgi:hypothetical protein
MASFLTGQLWASAYTFFLAELGLEFRDLVLAWQELYHLNHSTSPNLYLSVFHCA